MIWFVKSQQQEPIAQLVEQQTFNLRVLGSSPSGLTLICEIWLAPISNLAFVDLGKAQ